MLELLRHRFRHAHYAAQVFGLVSLAQERSVGIAPGRNIPDAVEVRTAERIAPGLDATRAERLVRHQLNLGKILDHAGTRLVGDRAAQAGVMVFHLFGHFCFSPETSSAPIPKFVSYRGSTFTNFGIKGALANYMIWCGFEFEVPMKRLPRN